MGKIKLPKIVSTARETLIKHSPAILTGVGIVGMLGTTIMAVKATPKALRLIEERKRELECDELTVPETIKTAWKCYIPAVVTGVTSTACLIGASSVHARRNTALLTAYNLSQAALSEYKDKVIEVVGEEADRKIQHDIVKDRIEKNPPATNELVVLRHDYDRYYDAAYGKYFESNEREIEKAMNTINREIVRDMYASLNGFYIELGVDPIDVGDDVGWNIDDGPIEIEYDSILGADGRAYIAIRYNVPPHYKYSSFT